MAQKDVSCPGKFEGHVLLGCPPIRYSTGISHSGGGARRQGLGYEFVVDDQDVVTEVVETKVSGPDRYQRQR
jgi:hypothetical protein